MPDPSPRAPGRPHGPTAPPAFPGLARRKEGADSRPPAAAASSGPAGGQREGKPAPQPRGPRTSSSWSPITSIAQVAISERLQQTGRAHPAQGVGTGVGKRRGRRREELEEEEAVLPRRPQRLPRPVGASGRGSAAGRPAAPLPAARVAGCGGSAQAGAYCSRQCPELGGPRPAWRSPVAPGHCAQQAFEACRTSAFPQGNQAAVFLSNKSH